MYQFMRDLIACVGMTEAVDVFYQETNYVTLLIFWLLIDVCFLLLHVSFMFDCLVYFFHYSVLRVRFYNKIIIIRACVKLAYLNHPFSST